MNDLTSDAVRFRFPAVRRLKVSREFERVRKEGSAVRGGLLVLSVLPVDGEKRFRVGLITSRRVGGAVARNRVRRRLREIVRRNQQSLKGGIWFVVIARRLSAQTDSAALEAEWLRLAQRAGIL
jgi:ribonuclease P protein component